MVGKKGGLQVCDSCLWSNKVVQSGLGDWRKTRAMVTTAHAHMPFRVWSGILVPSRGWMVVRTETKAVGGAVSPQMARNSQICWSYHPPPGSSPLPQA